MLCGTLCGKCLGKDTYNLTEEEFKEQVGFERCITFLDGTTVWYCTICDYEKLTLPHPGYKQILKTKEVNGHIWKKTIRVIDETKHRHTLHGKYIGSHPITQKHKRREGEFESYEEWVKAGKPKPEVVCRIV